MCYRHPNTMSVSSPNPRSMPAANIMGGMTNTNEVMLQAGHSRAAGVAVLRSSSTICRQYRPIG